jgi:hypothetical protein
MAAFLLAGILPATVLAAVPAAPSVPDLAASSDTGSSNTDNITKTLVGLVFTGTAEASSTVKIYVAGTTVIGTATATAGGAYTVTTTVSLPDNTPNLITATATNGSGEGPFSGALTVTTDNTPPGAPSAPDLQAASDTGTSSTDNLTADTTPTFDGTAEPGATVQLFAGATNVGTTVANAATGAWTITSTVLGVGTYTFTAVQWDAAGNGPSASSGGLSVTIDTTVPAAPSAPDLQAGSDTGSSSTDNITSDTTPTFGGTAPANTRVDLYAGANVVGTTTSDGGGAWTITSSALSAGTYVFTAVAVGLYGPSAPSPGLSVTIYTSLTVTVNQASTQVDPTGTSPVNFTVVFSQSVSDFVTGDATIGGTAGATTATVTGSGTTYNVAVTGMTTNGPIIVSVGAGKATDAAGNANTASTSSDNTVTWAPGGPTVTINQAASQVDPAFVSPVNFTVVFSAVVTDFATGDVVLSGTAGATTATVTGSGTTYNVAVSGMTTSGTVVATIPQGVATAGGLPNVPSTSSDNSITWQPGPTVTINQASGQADPTSTSPINFTVVFSAAVTGFTTGDVTITGTAGGTLVGTVTGSGTTYNVAVSGMTTGGTVIATVPAGVAVDLSVRPNLASTSTDNSVTWSPGGPTVTINQASGQADPTSTSPINFTVVFSAAVTGFTTGDVTITGTAGGTKTATVTGSGTTYNVAVTGMTTAGTVIATVPASVAVNASLLPNVASTSTDNTVTWGLVTPTISLTTSAPVIVWGSQLILTTRFGTGGAGRTFQLQASSAGATWATIASLTTDASGLATFVYQPGTNGYYRAVFAGAADLAAANSNTIRSLVRQIALLRPTNSGRVKSISRGTSITFTATVRPARPDLTSAKARFALYRLVGSRWVLISTRDAVLNASGVARTTYRFSVRGTWAVRVRANPTAQNADSFWSPLERYAVR